MTQFNSYKHRPSVYFIICLGILLTFTNCKDTNNRKQSGINTVERLEIFGVKPEIKEKDTLLYVEQLVKSGEKEASKTYFDQSNVEVGKETYLYEAEATLPYGSNYTGPDGKNLSYYRYVYNGQNQKVMMVAFDGQNDAILRYERYQYDANGHLTVKEISDANLQPNRNYIFENDKYGNVNSMTILGENADTIAIETYKTTKYDDQQTWVEKWGFIDDLPKTYYIKSIK